MKEIYIKKITRMPDSLPVRSEKGIEVDSTDGKVTDIYVVDEAGRKHIDLDGNVKESYSKTITENGTVIINNAEYGEQYTSVKEVSVTVDCPTIDSAKEVRYTENGEYTISPTGTNSGIASATVTVDIPNPELESKEVSYTENGTYTVTPDEAYGLSSVEVTVDVSTGWITVMADKQYNSMLDAEELNMMDVKGALFSWNAETSKYTVWNADEIKVWDYTLDCSSHYIPGSSPSYTPSWNADVEFPTNEYGEVIAVCAGKGIWVSTKWDQRNGGNKFKWCPSDSPLYSFQWDCFDLSGAEVAKKMYAKDAETLAGSIFAAAKDFEGIENDGTKGHWFVPSKSEIFQAILDCANENRKAVYPKDQYTYTNAYYNAAHIFETDDIWSCSLGIGGEPEYALVLFDTAVTSTHGNKSYNNDCIVCLHFGDMLVGPAVASDSDQDIGVE